MKILWQRTALLVLVLITLSLSAVAQKRVLRRGVNFPAYNQIYPAVSGDGQSMVYLSTYSESGDYELRYTWKENGEWADPVTMPLVQDIQANFKGGFSLSYDGTKFYFTSERMNGIGTFDIWYSELSGRSWGAPKNPGKPLNSNQSDGFPFLSPDGQWLYFVRCGGMLPNKCVDCQMYRAKRRNKEFWNEPELLPAPLNMGNETSPQLLSDNRTLVFASDRAGGKGGMDLYLSRLENGNWTQPTALDFLNTEGNDEGFSIPAPGNLAYFEASLSGRNQLAVAIVPPENRPLNILQISGVVTDEEGNPLDVAVQVYNLETQEQEQFVRTGEDGDGNYTITIPEGQIYDFSVISADNQYTYFADRLDIQEMDQSARITRPITLTRVEAGVKVLMPNITLDSATLQVERSSMLDVRRLIRMMRNTRRPVRILTVVPPLPPPPPMDSSALVLIPMGSDSLGTLDSTAMETVMMATDTSMLSPTLTVADMELIGWNRAQALVDFLRGQGVPENFLDKGVITWDEARSLAPEYWPDDRILELVVVEIAR